MYSTYNEGKSVVTQRFIRTLKSKILKHMTAVSKNIYFDVLDDIVNEYNNKTVHRTVHRTIKKKPIEVTSNSYAEYNEDSNKKILSLKLMIVLEYHNTTIFFLKDTLQIGQKTFLLSVYSSVDLYY